MWHQIYHYLLKLFIRWLLLRHNNQPHDEIVARSHRRRRVRLASRAHRNSRLEQVHNAGRTQQIFEQRESGATSVKNKNANLNDKL